MSNEVTRKADLCDRKLRSLVQRNQRGLEAARQRRTCIWRIQRPTKVAEKKTGSIVPNSLEVIAWVCRSVSSMRAAVGQLR